MNAMSSLGRCRHFWGFGNSLTGPFGKLNDSGKGQLLWNLTA